MNEHKTDPERIQSWLQREGCALIHHLTGVNLYTCKPALAYDNKPLLFVVYLRGLQVYIYNQRHRQIVVNLRTLTRSGIAPARRHLSLFPLAWRSQCS